MDTHNWISKQMFIASNRLTETLEWEHNWIHFRTGDEINLNHLIEVILSSITYESMILIISRNDFKRIVLSSVPQVLKNLAGAATFQLWNNTMTKSIKFNKISVYNRSK